MTESRMAVSRFLERYGIWLVVLVMMVTVIYASMMMVVMISFSMSERTSLIRAI